MVPVPVGAVLTGQDGVADQLVARQTLKRDGLANVVTSSSYNTISKRFRVRAFLQLVGWEGEKKKKKEKKKGMFRTSCFLTKAGPVHSPCCLATSSSYNDLIEGDKL